MLVAKEQMRDLGRIKFGTINKFSFILLNRGNKDVVIKKAIVSCSSCTQAVIKNRVVRPMSDSAINVTFTPGTIGKQKKHIDIIYDNDQNLRLDFIAESHG